MDRAQIIMHPAASCCYPAGMIERYLEMLRCGRLFSTYSNSHFPGLLHLRKVSGLGSLYLGSTEGRLEALLGFHVDVTRGEVAA